MQKQKLNVYSISCSGVYKYMKTVLVVDDNKTNLITVKGVLGDIYKTILVTKGEQALKYLDEHDVDLILLDINMPEMDGFEVMRQLKASDYKRHIPVIFLTAANDVETESRCLKNGAADFISKPFVSEVMLARIAKTIELEELRNNLARRLNEKTKEVKTFKAKSQKDGLTGLWNRSYTEDYVNRILKKSKDCALFMIDMDNFKSINDKLGHIAGDKTLKLFAEVLKEMSVHGAVACRLGGDEFIYFATHCKVVKEIRILAEEMLRKFDIKMEQNGINEDASVSIGISRFPKDVLSFDELYSAADKALYHVKENGKGSYAFYKEKEDLLLENNILIDFDHLNLSMNIGCDTEGSYVMDFESFRHIYEYNKRLCERQPKNIQLALFTLHLSGDVSDISDIEFAMEELEVAVLNYLRREDASARYSNRQLIVMLVGADNVNGKMVADRMVEHFRTSYAKDNIQLQYELMQVCKEE